MKLLKLITILLITTSIYSQSNFNKKNDSPFIEVIGRAEKEIVPDEIYIDICIKERIEKGEKLTIDFLEKQFKTELKKIGISEKNLSISDVNAVLSKTGWWRKDEVLSTANYTLKVDGAEKLKKLFERLNFLKITEVNITKATHSKIVLLRKENRISAIKAAKEKSDYLLNAIGVKTGKPIEINEIINNGQQNFINANNINYSSSYKISEVRNYVVQFEKIKISTSIYIKFQIK